LQGGAKIVGTGRSDYCNQVNNLLAFPGIFRGALDAHATEITEGMKMAAARAISEYVSDKELSTDYVLPSNLDKKVAIKVAEYVKKQAIKENITRTK
jgi:malate dehydrogenase (oxaloacetate-decarboxylating)